MKNIDSELIYERKRLEQTISVAQNQLNQAELLNEDNSASIVSLKEEMRESTSHSISGLWNAQNFEDLVALGQYTHSLTSQIADYEATASKIAKLKQLIDSPYFARIDFRFDSEEQGQMIYIGRFSLMKNNPNEIVVYDWRSPIASVFYRFGMGQAFYDAPHGKITGEVTLKRQYEIKKGALEYFFDADVQIIDEFLRKLLSQSASSKMKAIVETIQREQDMVIRDMDNDLMMVQGVAGSGKTSIALQRAAYLMYQGLSVKLSAQNILIISPNPLFEQYISNVLPELGEENVVSLVLEDILMKVLRAQHMQTRNQFLEQLITNPQYSEIRKRSIEFKTSRGFLEIINRLIDDIPHRWIDFADIHFRGQCVIRKEQLRSRLLSGRKETPLGLKLIQLEDFILESVHTLRGNRPNKAEDRVIKKEIRKFIKLNIKNLYQNIFKDREYFYDLAKGIDLPGCIEEVLRYTCENLETSFLCYDDAAALAYLRLKITGENEYQSIKQVVIDEAQDYYPLHYEILKMLFPKCKYTILGDINQTFEKNEDLSLYEQIGRILNKERSILITMDKSFRCTNEILNYSARLISYRGKIKSFNRKGEKPQVYAAADQQALVEMIGSEARLCLEKGYQSIGLLSKSEKNARSLFACLKENLDVQFVGNDSTAELRGVLAIPIYMAKGLEFDAVILCDADEENYHTEEDQKLLYIACTRALHRLTLLFKGKISPFL